MKKLRFTQPDCPPCVIVKEFLKHNNVVYEEFDVKRRAAARNRLLYDYDSYSTPTVVLMEKLLLVFKLKNYNNFEYKIGIGKDLFLFYPDIF